MTIWYTLEYSYERSLSISLLFLLRLCRIMFDTLAKRQYWNRNWVSDCARRECNFCPSDRFLSVCLHRDLLGKTSICEQNRRKICIFQATHAFSTLPSISDFSLAKTCACVVTKTKLPQFLHSLFIGCYSVYTSPIWSQFALYSKHLKSGNNRKKTIFCASFVANKMFLGNKLYNIVYVSRPHLFALRVFFCLFLGHSTFE